MPNFVAKIQLVMYTTCKIAKGDLKMTKTGRIILNGVFLLAAAAIPSTFTYFTTRNSIENRSLERFESNFESVTTNMPYGQAIEAIFDETDRLRRTLSNLESQQITEATQNTERFAVYRNQISTLEADVNRLVSEIHMSEQQASAVGQNHEESLEQIRHYRGRIRELEEETINLRAEINVFLARGESPVLREPDGRPATIMRLAEVTSIQHNFFQSDIHHDNYRNVYTDVVALRRGDTFRGLLDERYTRLRGTLFIAYGETNYRSTTIRIEREGELPISHRMDRTTRPIDIDIDLTGVNEFSITTDGDRNHRGPLFPYVYFAYLRLYP